MSYADLVTLLLAFFATAYAISNLDAAKVTPAAAAIRSALGTEAAEPTGAGGSPSPETVSSMGERLVAALADDIAEGRVDVVSLEGQVVLSLPEAASFDSGSAEVSADAKQVLTRFLAVLVESAGGVRVEGHTDDVPIGSGRFASNWDLSTARASAVVARLIAGGVEPARLSAAGYAEFHPRVPNDSAAARAVNRRVDIVILPQAAVTGVWGLRP